MNSTIDIDKKFEEFKQAYSNMMKTMAEKLSIAFGVVEYKHHP